MNYNSINTLKNYWQRMKKFRLTFFLAFTCIAGAGLASVIRPLYFKDFFDILSTTTDKPIGYHLLLGIIFSVMILHIIEWTFWRLAIVMATRFQTGMMSELYNYSFQYLHKHSVGYFENTFVGSIVKKVNKYVWAFIEISSALLWNLMNLFINIVFITTVLFLKNIMLGVIIVAWIVLFFIVNTY